MGISTTNPDLFRAILAMDAYNRGYNAGVNLDPVATAIGLATIGRRTNALTEPDAVAASFFAQSYTLNGQTIISFRGTDYAGDNLTTPFNGDIWNGWGIGLGSPYGAQALLALEFYRQVAGRAAKQSGVMA
jgi:hypothetical protein